MIYIRTQMNSTKHYWTPLTTNEPQKTSHKPFQNPQNLLNPLFYSPQKSQTNRKFEKPPIQLFAKYLLLNETVFTWNELMYQLNPFLFGLTKNTETPQTNKKVTVLGQLFEVSSFFYKKGECYFLRRRRCLEDLPGHPKGPCWGFLLTKQKAVLWVSW